MRVREFLIIIRVRNGACPPDSHFCPKSPKNPKNGLKMAKNLTTDYQRVTKKMHF
jgi:biotin synthase-like enzyme